MKIVPVIVASFTLAACAPDQRAPQSYGNDMLPSAEVTAFRQADARLKYNGARIEHDANGCAFYQGTASDGRIKHEPLVDASNQPICSRR